MNAYKKVILLSGSLLIATSGISSAADRGIIQFYGMITTPTCQVSTAAAQNSPTALSCLTSTANTQNMTSVSENTKQSNTSSTAYRTESLLAAVSQKNLVQTSPQKIVTVTYY